MLTPTYAGSTEVPAVSSIVYDLAPNLAQQFDIWESDMDMYYPVDFGESAVAPAVIAAAASKMNEERISGRCWVVDEEGATWFIARTAQGYLGLYENQKNPPVPSDGDVTIVVQPAHGQLMRLKEKDIYHYKPDEGYLGGDRIESLVLMWDGKVVRIVDNIIVQSVPIDSPGFDGEEKFCPRPYWKISQSPETDSNAIDLASWIRSSSLSWLLSGAQSCPERL
jgi:hypothetical protein